MLISKEKLGFEAETTGFRPEILEKVIYLIHLLNQFSEHPYLKNRFVLKGGTALNLFYFDYPRLSVDIDINYIGSNHRETMLQERKEINVVIKNILLEEKLILQRKSSEHAGEKWVIRYPSALRGYGIIEIDFNFLDRVPLWPIKKLNSFKLGQFQANNIPVQDLHELMSGKLRALFSRHSSRDLFDAHQLLINQKTDIEKARLGFIIYGAASRMDWRNIKLDSIQFDWRELQNMLIPLIRKSDLSKRQSPKQWAETILTECKVALNHFLPFREHEVTFLDKLLDKGSIDASLLTTDEALKDNIHNNPALMWKVLNVKQLSL